MNQLFKEIKEKAIEISSSHKEKEIDSNGLKVMFLNSLAKEGKLWESKQVPKKIQKKD